MWGEPIVKMFNQSMLKFQLTRPVWGEPFGIFVFAQCSVNFNSLAPCGANLDGMTIRRDPVNFNSLAPCGANPV